MVCIFEIIYMIPYIIKQQLIKCYGTNIIIRHIHDVSKLPRTFTIYFLSRNISKE